ncbi:MAG: hypothetical protein HON90_15080 [Halobacteriovoraceae bacterium]|jgi:hypothetical protein|nr:hypothetical protein [Halobacteriovoraceae bacterium]
MKKLISFIFFTIIITWAFQKKSQQQDFISNNDPITTKSVILKTDKKLIPISSKNLEPISKFNFNRNLQEKLSRLNKKELFQLLTAKDQEVYLSNMKELFGRNLQGSEKDSILHEIKKQDDEILAASLLQAFKLGSYPREKIISVFHHGISKNYTSALSLILNAHAFQFSRDEFQEITEKSCQHNDDEELYQKLKFNIKKQAIGLGLTGFYVCDSF